MFTMTKCKEKIAHNILLETVQWKQVDMVNQQPKKEELQVKLQSREIPNQVDNQTNQQLSLLNSDKMKI